jgi:hypothetical protein
MTIAEGEAAGDYTMGRIGQFAGDVVDPTSYDIVPLAGDGQNGGSRFGFLETSADDDDVDPSLLCSLMDTDSSRHDGIVSKIESNGMVHPQHNIDCNHNEDN